MADFAVPHLPFRQSDERSAGMDQRVGIFAQQAIVRRFARERDGISFRLGAVAPSVEDDENKWLRTHVRNGSWLLALGSWLLALAAGWDRFATRTFYDIRRQAFSAN